MDPLNTEKPVNKDAETPKVDTPPIVSPDAPIGEEKIQTPAPVVVPEAVAQEIPTAPVSPETPAIVAPTDASTTPSGDDFGYTETKSNKLLYIFVFVLVVVLLSLVGLFFYKQFTSTTAGQPVQEVAPTVAESPAAEPATEEEAELDQIEIPDLDQELQDINTDIEQL
ncbi:hypothetical protein COY16_03325 [Candidatus Roizmanbacteria bacterium CG_4_10_14_0_2_um_filter_39_13]|uniref:Uncharacterized protein n=1 Tax=Candidatus Roizmanbacteria bacterium CG_4_10_14_0_2_um_filter_39_13 TaxID=1974825 RepID=A0A2M7TYG6_9BACT|nr:MAG: hypothetical protein COY16_03325 [Candidatus Roizmanbacteria bacterium CG_4_10_14_0_2_um_filter_39_13]